MIQLLAIRLSDDNAILAVQWYNPANGAVSAATQDVIIDYLKKGGSAFICDGVTIQTVKLNEHEAGSSTLLVSFDGVERPLSLPRF